MYIVVNKTVSCFMLLPMPGDKHEGLGTRQSDKKAAVRGEDTGGVVRQYTDHPVQKL